MAVCAMTERLHFDAASSVTFTVDVHLLQEKNPSLTIWHAASSIKSLHFVAALRCSVTHDVYCFPHCLLDHFRQNFNPQGIDLRVMQDGILLGLS